MVEIVNIFGLMGIILGIFILGGGGFYIIWLKTRPKKMTWKARIYQRGEGIKPFEKDKKGNIISNVELNDLRPYKKDVIEKIVKEPGIVIYRLIDLNKTVPAVTSECVDYWGENDKEVAVIMEGDTCTILKKGYDKKAGNLLFKPMPHDRINMIKGEIAIRKDRLGKTTDILQAIMPWVMSGIFIVGMIGLSYIIGGSYVEISENLKEASDYQADKLVEAAKIMKGISLTEVIPEIIEELPPSVE